jgi:hypothetical protein
MSIRYLISSSVKKGLRRGLRIAYPLSFSSCHASPYPIILPSPQSIVKTLELDWTLDTNGLRYANEHSVTSCLFVRKEDFVRRSFALCLKSPFDFESFDYVEYWFY